MVSFLTKIISIFFIMALCSCKKNAVPNSSLLNTQNNLINIDGNWVLYQYQLFPSGAILSKSDTLKFVSKTNYYYNSVLSNYELTVSQTVGSSYRLYLKNTAFGNILGTIPNNFQDIGEINGAGFSPPQSSVTNTITYACWLRKI